MITTVRARLGAPLAIVLVMTLTSVALASRIEVGASHTQPFKGSDRYGRVSFQFGDIETRSGSAHPGNIVTITRFRFASECSPGGTLVPGTFRIGANGHFHSTARGFTVTGRLVGSQQSRAVGTAQVNRDCDGDSDPVQFTARATN
jgi:hypothetical protein